VAKELVLEDLAIAWQAQREPFERDLQAKRPDCHLHCNYRNDKGNPSSYLAKKCVHEHGLWHRNISCGQNGRDSQSFSCNNHLSAIQYGERSHNNLRFCCQSSRSCLSIGPTWGYSIIHLRFAPSPLLLSLSRILFLRGGVGFKVFLLTTCRRF
jgi:hypothetical protein